MGNPGRSGQKIARVTTHMEFITSGDAEREHDWTVLTCYSSEGELSGSGIGSGTGQILCD